MSPKEHSADIEDLFLTRRQFLQRAGMGFGALSLAGLFGGDIFSPLLRAAETEANLLPKSPMFPARAKHVVHKGFEGLTGHKHQKDSWDAYIENLEKTFGDPTAAGLLKFIIDGYTLGYGWDTVRTICNPFLDLAGGKAEAARAHQIDADEIAILGAMAVGLGDVQFAADLFLVDWN